MDLRDAIARKPIDRNTHAALDYLTIGAFLTVAGLSWDRNRRGGVAALVNGLFVLSYSMFTDYRGSLRRLISFPTHKKLDIVQASMAAGMPTVMGFRHSKCAKFMHGQAVNETGVLALTDWEGPEGSPRERVA